MESDPEIISFAVVGDVIGVSRLIEHDRDCINQTDALGFTALHCAADLGDPEFVKYLLQAGADCKAQNKVGITALHLAQNAPIVELLVEAGANIEHRNADGETPLQVLAAEPNSYWAMKKLLQFGANPNAADNSGITSMEIVKERNETRKVVLLRAFGATEKNTSR